MGLIMVIGIVAKNGILLLDADDRFRTEGQDARTAMLLAAQRRLRPIVTTALAAVTGKLPIGSGHWGRFVECCSRWRLRSSGA